MNVRATAENLDQEIVDALKDWTNTDLRRAVNEAIEESAATAAKELRKGGPYQDRTGNYSKDWGHKLRARKYSSVIHTEEYTVYNKKHYQLTHLLEKGHQSRNGKRKVPAFEHIAPVAELVEQLVISNIGKKVREIT